MKDNQHVSQNTHQHDCILVDDIDVTTSASTCMPVNFHGKGKNCMKMN